MARQVGNYPYLVHNIFKKQCHLPVEALGIGPEKEEQGRREWGMRMVHEIISGGPETYLPEERLNKSVYRFGYGSDEVKVWTYWDDAPAFNVDHAKVKGLLMTRPRDGKMLLVVQSWSATPVQTDVTFDTQKIGFKPGDNAYEGFGNRVSALSDSALKVTFDFPYETKVFLLGPEAPAKGVLFQDRFDDWLNPGWDYLSPYATLEKGCLKIGKNRAHWFGKPRLFKHQNLPEFRDGDLSFSFQLESLPTSTAGVLSAGFGTGVAMSKHGLSHSDLKRGVSFSVTADVKRGWVWKAAVKEGSGVRTLAHGVVGAVDLIKHGVAITRVADGTSVVTMDGRQVLRVEEPAPQTMNSFGLTILSEPDRTFGALYLDDITLRSDHPDDTALKAQWAAAKVRSREVLRAQIDELKQSIIAAFGIVEHKAIYNLAMFRRPETDVADLIQRLKTEANAGRRSMLLAVLRELPKREQEHVDGMKAIGQPAHRQPEFKRARAAALKGMRELSPLPDKRQAKEIQQTIVVLTKS
jgi:hypothetical protein